MINDETFDNMIKEEFGEVVSQENTEVNHPSHYNREGGVECFDEFELIFGKEAAMYACLFNIWKYRYRASNKNGENDLAKSDWYMKKYQELVMTPQPAPQEPQGNM